MIKFKNKDNYELFWYFVNERQKITNLKKLSVSPPWTSDEILQKAYINNIDRADDKGTIFLSQIIDSRKDINKVYLIMLYRFTGSNVPLFKELIKLPYKYWAIFIEKWPSISCAPYQNPAFPKGKGIGKDFLLNIIPLISIRLSKLIETYEGSVKDLVKIICSWYIEYKSFGKTHRRYYFHSNEICKDLSYYFSSIKREYACHIGPGAIKGFRRIYKRTKLSDGLEDLKNDERYKSQKLNNDLLEGALCEYNKYMSYKIDGRKIKRNYDLNKKDYSVDFYLDLLKNFTSKLPEPVIEKYNNIFVVRDDLIMSSRIRFLEFLISTSTNDEIISIQPRIDLIGPSLINLCELYNKKLTLFLPSSKEMSDHQAYCAERKCSIKFKRIASMTVLKKYAKDYSSSVNGLYVSPDLEDCRIMACIVSSALKVKLQLPKIDKICVALNTGQLNLGLQKIFKDSSFRCIDILHKLKVGIWQNGELLEDTSPYEKEETNLPPFDSLKTWDAKVWKYLKDISPDKTVLFWNSNSNNVKPSTNIKYQIVSFRSWTK